MNEKQRFFICDDCKNIVDIISMRGIPIICCGIKMTELEPNTVEASNEKHLPEVTMSSGTMSVQVGSVPHPMVDEHYVQFIHVETESGGQRKDLKPGDEPNAEFSFIKDKPIAVYEYCNLHGLWKTEVIPIPN